MLKIAFPVALLLVLGQSATVEAGAPSDRMIVRWKNPDKILSAEHWMRGLGALEGLRPTGVRHLGPDLLVLELPAGISAAQRARFQKALAGRVDVAYVQPDRLVKPMAQPPPNDPFYINDSQWSLSGPAGANLGPAWERSTGLAGQVIAVIDTGILPDHPDLGGKILPGFDFVSDPKTANDGGGWDSDPTDPGDAVAAGECAAGSPAETNSWHGTFVSGIIAGVSNNSIGMAGVNWQTRILPVRALGKCGGLLSELLVAMRWAAGLHVEGAPDNPNPARILNLSLGAAGSCGRPEQDVLSELQQKGAVVVTAAGNGASAIQNAPLTPAICPGVITVAATDRQGQLAPYSNYGSQISVSAPGGYISGTQNAANGILSLSRSSDNSYTYAYNAGTSFSTALVSGIASLMLAINPRLTPADLNQILRDTAVPIQASDASSPCATPGNCGAGRVDGGAAVVRAQGFTPGSSAQPQTPVAGPAPSSSSAPVQSGGGGGCVLAGGDSPDATLVLLPALLWLGRRLHMFRQRLS